MNELIYSFLNEIEDVNKIHELTVEEFTKLVKANKLISEDDAKKAAKYETETKGRYSLYRRV